MGTYFRFELLEDERMIPLMVHVVFFGVFLISNDIE